VAAAPAETAPSEAASVDATPEASDGELAEVATGAPAEA